MIPIINEINKPIKNEIIKNTGLMLELEKVKLADLVNFDDVMVQNFDSIEVIGNSLMLHYKDKIIKLAIKKQAELVKKAMEKFVDNVKIELSELYNLKVIDYDKQELYKNYIDDLIFALYFNIDFKKLGLENANLIKQICSTNKYYKVAAS
jgi:hypothetical protein